MPTSNDDHVEELLAEWELARQRGIDLSLDELCSNSPGLTDQVKRGIESLKATSWMLVDEASQESGDSNVSYWGSTPQDNTQAFDSDVTVAEFLDLVSSSGILSEMELHTIEEHAEGRSTAIASELAEQLVHEGVITKYQAKILLKRGEGPLLLDRYVILDAIGAGGMGLVFKALHRSMERIVALKVLPHFAVDSPEKVRRFRREIKAAGKCSHPNVVAAFDAHESNGTFFLVMEYVYGVNLREHIEKTGPMPVSDAVRVIAEVAAGLGEAHRHGIIHRDIKPTNIMLTPDGTAKLLDLGLSRTKRAAANASRTELTRDGLGLGTVSYMAPEQAFDAKQADFRSDIYSLGCTLFFLLVGEPPFERDTSVQTIIAHREEDSPPLSEARPDVPDSIQDIYECMVAKDPDARFATATEVQDALLASNVMLAESQSSAPVIVKPVRKKYRPFKGWDNSSEWSKWVYAALGGLSVIAVALVGLLIWQPWKEGDAVHRDLARWVLRTNGSVIVDTDFGEQELYSAEEIPMGSLQVVGIEFYDARGIDSLEPISKISGLQSLDIKHRSRSLDLNSLLSIGSFPDLSLTDSFVRDDDLKIIAQMKGLEELNLSDNPITDAGIQHLTELTKLRKLVLNGENFTGRSLELVATLPNLTRLDITRSAITGQDLKLLPTQLRSLRLAMCSIDDEDLALLLPLKNLELLDLEGTEVTGVGIKSLVDLAKLRHLDLSHTHAGADAIRALQALPSFAELMLNGVPITDEMIEALIGLKHLETIELRGTDIKDDQFIQLSEIESLHSLDVMDTVVSQPTIDKFYRKRPDCAIYVDEDKL